MLIWNVENAGSQWGDWYRVDRVCPGRSRQCRKKIAGINRAEDSSMLEAGFAGIIDSTLREGEQAPGAYFSSEQKLSIIKGLCAVGVDEVEIGVASPRYPELVSLAREASTIAGGRSLISLWCRCCEEDIRFASECMPDVLSLSMPVSDIQLREKLCRDRSWALKRLERSIGIALDSGVSSVAVGLEDATRADDEFLLEVAGVVSGAGAARLRLADTVGIASPGEIAALVRKVSENASIPLAIHAHNDFGMATANAVAAVESGARWVDATVLGLGERAGNCRLEELIGYLSLCRGMDRYRPEKLHGLCRTVAAAAGLSISSFHPVIGENIFTCETGLHVHGLAGNPRTYEPYDPGRLGRRRAFLFGGKTGRGAVRSSLAASGYFLAEKDVEDLVMHVRSQAQHKQLSLDERGLVLLARAKGFIK